MKNLSLKRLIDRKQNKQNVNKGDLKINNSKSVHQQIKYSTPFISLYPKTENGNKVVIEASLLADLISD